MPTKWLLHLYSTQRGCVSDNDRLVDDIITVANNKTEIDRAEAEMKSKYTVKVIGEPTMLLGIHITCDHTK